MPKKFKTCVQMSRGFKNNFKRMKQKLRAWGIFIQCIFGVSPQTANEALNDSHDRLQEDETKSKIVYRRVRGNMKALIFLKIIFWSQEIMAHGNYILWSCTAWPWSSQELWPIITMTIICHNDYFIEGGFVGYFASSLLDK